MLKKINENDFDKVFCLLQDSFPPDERRPYEEQKALLSAPTYDIYVLSDEEKDAVKVFITVYRLKEFAFIEHFATARQYRNQGLGGTVLRELRDLLQCNLCLEVELPETDFAKRRIAFYERNGFYLNEYPYIQPPMSKGLRSIPLYLMTSEGPVDRTRFERIKNTLYKEIYKVKE